MGPHLEPQLALEAAALAQQQEVESPFFEGHSGCEILQSSTGLQAEPNITIIAALLALLQQIPNWVVAGDWNVDLDKFAGTNIATSARGEILGSRDAAIESGNTLDFVMASRSVAGLVRLSVDKVVPFAPHFCLMLEIDLAHGLLNLPTLKGFAGLQGALPAPSPTPALTHHPGPALRPAGSPSAGTRPGPCKDTAGYPHLGRPSPLSFP